MRINTLSISNFKALAKVELADLALFNVIVGTNGSGKSSVLQALHWALQSGRNPEVTPKRLRKDASTLSPSQADYLPSPGYKNASNTGSYGNHEKAPALAVNVWSALRNV